MLATPTACTSFSSAPEDAGTDVATDGGPSSPDAGGDGPPRSSDCRVSCPQPGCLREPFDTPLGGGWKKRSSSGGIIDVSGGVFRSQVEGGNAYLARPLSARTRARLSVAVVVDQKPKDGTSLAKIVDGNSKGEVNIQFDGGDVRACVVLAGTPGPPQCTTPRALPGGLEVHLGLEGAGGVSYDDLDLTPVF